MDSDFDEDYGIFYATEKNFNTQGKNSGFMNDFEHKQHLHKLPLSFKSADFDTVA